MGIVKYNLKNLPPVKKKDLDRVDAIKDEDIDFSDIPEITDFSKFHSWEQRSMFKPVKVAVYFCIITAFLAMSLVFTACPEKEKDTSVTGIVLDHETIDLIVGAKETLTYTIDPAIPKNTLKWSSSKQQIVRVDENGVVTAVGISEGGNSAYSSGAATGQAVVTVTTADRKYSDSVTINTSTASRGDIMDLPPLKNQFANYFLIGNIFDPADAPSALGVTTNHLIRHYNVLTAQNHMKPSYLVSNRSGTTINLNATGMATAKLTVDAAIASGFKVVGHTLLWHSQTTNLNLPSSNKEESITIMRNFITAIMNEFKGKIYSWDVLNEAFPDNASSSANWKNAIRTGGNNVGNPWYVAIGSDFVYEGFLAARLADPDAILYYNDYNTDKSTRARLIRDMVLEVNNKYLAGSDKPAGEDPNRLLIEGIGMQEHHNTGVSANAIRTTLNLFKNMSFTGSNRKIKISVSELDVLAQSWNDYDVSKAAVTNNGIIRQSELYAEYMKVYLEFKDIIERVSLWGVTDNKSWRSRGMPLLFDRNGKAKPAYYSFVGVLE